MKYAISKGIFLLLLLLWGCGPYSFINDSPVRSIAVKVATTYCESNQGVDWIQAKVSTFDNKETKYIVQFRCKNGLQSDWQEMTEEPKKELLK